MRTTTGVTLSLVLGGTAIECRRHDPGFVQVSQAFSDIRAPVEPTGPKRESAPDSVARHLPVTLDLDGCDARSPARVHVDADLRAVRLGVGENVRRWADGRIDRYLTEALTPIKIMEELALVTTARCTCGMGTDWTVGFLPACRIACAIRLQL